MDGYVTIRYQLQLQRFIDIVFAAKPWRAMFPQDLVQKIKLAMLASGLLC